MSDDRREVERLRVADVPAVYGDAANAELLRAAHVEAARVVIVAISDPQAARLIVDRARELAPRVPLVVRTHSGTEAAHLGTLGSMVQAVHAEREVAIQITRFSLRRFGISGAEAEAIAQGLRTGRGGEPPGGGGQAPPGIPAVARLRQWLSERRADRRAGSALSEPEPGAPPMNLRQARGDDL